MSNENVSLRGRVYQQIREDILNGRYRQGEELTESALGKEMGVSRTPVREAIRQLSLEGLVENIPNKGTFVTGITTQDIIDIYTIRSKLEGLCARLAARRITPEILEQMEETVYLSDYHTQREHYEQVVELDTRFHELMYQSCQSRILAHTLAEYHQYVRKARKLSLERRVRLKKSNKEHQVILNAIKARDEELAEKLATNHILNVIENLKNCDLHQLTETTEKQEDKNE